MLDQIQNNFKLFQTGKYQGKGCVMMFALGSFKKKAVSQTDWLTFGILQPLTSISNLDFRSQFEL